MQLAGAWCGGAASPSLQRQRSLAQRAPRRAAAVPVAASHCSCSAGASRRQLGARQQGTHALEPQQLHAPAWRSSECASSSTRSSSCSSGGCSSSRRRRVTAAASDYGEAYDNLFRSKVFQSEAVVREFDDIMGQLRQLSTMASRFPDFDLQGKEMFLDKMEENAERYKLFMKRLELCDDPAAKEYLRYTTAQMLNGGFSYGVMFEGLNQSLQQYRSWVQEERRVSSDPVKHQAFLAAFRQAWSGSALGSIDMGRLAQMVSPEVVANAQKDPDFFKAIKEISEDPSAMSRWQSHPNIGPLVSTMWRAMMAAKQGQQGGS